MKDSKVNIGQKPTGGNPDKGHTPGSGEGYRGNEYTSIQNGIEKKDAAKISKQKKSCRY